MLRTAQAGGKILRALTRLDVGPVAVHFCSLLFSLQVRQETTRLAGWRRESESERERERAEPREKTMAGCAN